MNFNNKNIWAKGPPQSSHATLTYVGPG